MESETISVIINRGAQSVYDYVLDLNHLPHWASAFVKSISLSKEGRWKAETDFGPHEFRIQERNNLGVLDHWVRPLNASEIYVPMRVIPVGNDALVLFTLIKMPGMDFARFEQDKQAVRRDLQSLKNILETSEK